MRKKLYLAALTAALSLGTAATAYAAQWVPDSSGWWYQEDGGSWPASTWKWIDGNQDEMCIRDRRYGSGEMSAENHIGKGKVCEPAE